MNPTRAERLTAGLMAMPDSLYRARILEDEPPTTSDESKTDKPTVLPWLGWDSKTMVAVEVRNMMNAVITAKYGGKNANRIHCSLPALTRSRLAGRTKVQRRTSNACSRSST